eukprot:TRINITY_DN116775_c0_g1_i1.p1 TRINITY_DN116775_c0_g1~~TRINITY_DN116775_c0_g1_i1.p1  ORF type:complete len:220 (-),score=26.72 TRINITY_DN116775_c0_g1_i1:116-775(-)
MAGPGGAISLEPAPAMPPPPQMGAVAAPAPPTPAPGGAQANDADWKVVSLLKTAAHPVTCVFHALFKILVLLVYIKGRWIGGSYVSTFIMATLFAAFDFWTVKNVTGRLLVGLRWWNHVRDDGSSEWVFESNPNEAAVNDTDRSIFWVLVYVWPLLWLLLLIFNVVNFAFNWVLLNIMMLVFAASNLAGYWKCSKDAKKRAQDFLQRQGMRAVAGAMGF